MRLVRSADAARLALVAAVVVATVGPVAPATAVPVVDGCQVFPADNIWNVPVDDLPVHPRSDDYVDRIGETDHVHADFGSGVWPPGSDSPIGIPFVTVPGTQPGVSVSFTYASESDPGPYPIPSNPPIEGGPSGTGDRHILMVDEDNCFLYELFDAWPNGDGTWRAGSGAIFDLSSHQLRPDGWTSADAAGLPILPGLVRYEEIEAGVIDHAIRFTAPQTQKAYVWPATHFASSITDTSYPPMGQRFRLKAGFDTSGFSPDVQIILEAMKTYGLILADNGSPWFISGAPDDRWNNSVLHELHDVPGSAFEAVDATVLMEDPSSGKVAAGAAVVSVVGGSAAVSDGVVGDIWAAVGPVERISGSDRYATAATLSADTFSPGVDVVFVARGDDFPDALTIASVAANMGGPILLAAPTYLPSATAAELARLAPEEIVAVGGPGALSDAVVAGLAGFASGRVTRIAGADRYATAVAISQTYRDPGVGAVYLATGLAFPDAMGAATAAAHHSTSVLLTAPGSLPASVASELIRLAPGEVIIAGGLAAIGSDVEDAVEALGLDVRRVAGPDRYATAVALSQDTFSVANHVWAATGADFPDALTAAAVAGAGDVPLLLVPPSYLHSTVMAEMMRLLD